MSAVGVDLSDVTLVDLGGHDLDRRAQGEQRTSARTAEFGRGFRSAATAGPQLRVLSKG